MPSGMWYSFPAGAECHPQSDDGYARGIDRSTGACSWTRHPVAKVVRGAALIAAGWNTSNSTSVPDNHQWSPAREQVQHNAELMDAAAELLRGAGDRCCGC